MIKLNDFVSEFKSNKRSSNNELNNKVAEFLTSDKTQAFFITEKTSQEVKSKLEDLLKSEKSVVVYELAKEKIHIQSLYSALKVNSLTSKAINVRKEIAHNQFELLGISK